MKDYLVTGETFVVGIGNIDKPPLQLHPISPSVASPVRTDNDAPRYWQITGITFSGVYEAKPDLFDPKMRYLDGNLRELKHVRAYSPKNNSLLRGQSRLVSAAKEARQHILGTQHNVTLLEHGGRISLVFHFEEDIDPKDFEDIKRRIIENYSGALQAGSIGVTSGGKLQIEELGRTAKDMDFANLQVLAQKAVAMQYNVPLPLISDNRQTQHNYGTAVLALYDDAVLPNARRVLGGLSEMLLPRYGLDPRKARLIADQDSVTALVMRRNEELKKRKDIGVETGNEIRAHMGREPAEGLDEHYIPANMVPVGRDIWSQDNAADELEPVLGGAGGAG